MYIVIELQFDGKAVANIVTVYPDMATAYNKYYTILAAAAVSSIMHHTAMIVDDTGAVHETKCFYHQTS